MGVTSEDLQQWVGKRHNVRETLSPVQVRQMAALTDDLPRLQEPAAAPLPLGWHWLYFNPIEVQSKLGPDGHPLRGDFLPPVALERRMWAGSRLTWLRPFRVGQAVDKESTILKVEPKSGRSGDMVIVTVAHSYRDAQGLLLEEEHDIVYRDKASAAETEALRQTGERIRAGEHVFEREGAYVQAVRADPVMLQRYSAATFNGHRIHYDADYSRNVEGYPGLVVHGPLIATLVLRLVEQQAAPGRYVVAFEFRAIRPSFDLGAFHVHASRIDGQRLQVWSTNNLGQVGIEGWVTLG